jgi:hypothetical protein
VRPRIAVCPAWLGAALLLGATLLLGGCASSGGGLGQAGYGEPHPGLSCVPFARALTGIDLHGDAASWWYAAAGRYRRTTRPQPGAILVLDVEPRLPHGHVAVVSRVVDARRIEVIQANWVPGELDRDQPVLDVSADNDWTFVRVWYPPIAAMGAHAYRALGFVLPDAPRDGVSLDRAASRAAALAQDGG